MQRVTSRFKIFVRLPRKSPRNYLKHPAIKRYAQAKKDRILWKI